jgi:alanine dehydrogenase
MLEGFMPSTRILTRGDVAALVEMAEVIPVVEEAFAAHARGEALMPAKVYLHLEEAHGGDFRAMPAYQGGTAGVKWVSSYPENPRLRSLPSVMGTYVLSDAATGAPIAIMDATWLTALRTGAAGAVASKHLFKGMPRRIGFVGCGAQARVLHQAHRVLYPDFLALCADASADAAAAFAAEIDGAVVSVGEASRADIVCVATSARTPVVTSSDIRPGTHLNAMGADAPGKQEIDPKILGHARVFIDDWEQATHSGEVNVPLHEGFYDRESIAGTLGDVILGTVRGRIRSEITLFDSTGLAVQDLAVARLVEQKARAAGVGIVVDLVS